MLSCTGKRSHRHTILHVSFSNSFGLASARPTPQGLSGAPQLSNVTVTLDAIVEAKKHSDGIYNHWRQAANYLIGTDDNENKLAALNLYNALKCVDELIQVSESYSYFTKKLKEKYCEVTGYMRIADYRVVDCWLKDCYISNPYAINAVLYIEDLPTLI